MDLDTQKEIQKHFERMYRQGQKPWRYHPPEKSLQEFFKRLEKEFGKAKILDACPERIEEIFGQLLL